MKAAPALADRLRTRLTELRLPVLRQSYEETAKLATQESWGYSQYLLELVERECEARHHSRVQRYLRESHLPLEKSLQTFDLTRLPLKLRQQVALLREGTFVERKENVLAFGPPGSGKTHLLCGLAQEWVRQDHRVLFAPCALLVQELLAARRDLALPRLLRRFSCYEALLIDDLGYVQQSREEMEVLFTLLAQRYEQGSVLITSNLPFSQWERIFQDPMTTAAAIDRLVHHSLILELNLPSYRLAQAHKSAPRGHPEEEETPSDPPARVTEPPVTFQGDDHAPET